MILSAAPTSVALPAASPSAREQKLLDRDQARLRDARSAVETLKARGANRSREAAEERKAAARRKVDQLKALLKMMQMGGPANAKALAQIARELKAAVQAYGGAGGATSDLGAGASPAVGTEAASGETGAADSEAAGPATHVADAETPADADPEAVTGDAAPKPAAEEAVNAKTDPYRRLAEETLTRGAEAARRNAEQDADREFLKGVRELTALLKSLARRAAQEARTDPAARADAEQAMKAAADVARATEQVAADLGAGGISITA